MSQQKVLKKRLTEISNRWHEASAVRNHLRQEEIQWVSEVSGAKYRLGLQQKVKDFLEKLQRNAQARSLGLFEEMLTAMVHDVMPDKHQDKVQMDLNMQNGKPSLDIVMNSNGKIEDILQGRGGSLTNIISAGLRFISLSRVKNRRFLVMDESDCWLSPDRVPAFANVVNQLSREVGMQSLVISHHNPENFSDGGRIIELYRDNGKVKTRVRSDIGTDFVETDNHEDINRTDLMNDVGIRYIHLKNFMSLKDVRIDLSPTVNVIVGPNDIGKSAILAAIKAVAENGGKEWMISHGKDECRVEIGIEDEMAIAWTYRRKGAKKTTYEMIMPDGETISEDNGRNLPEFIDEVLAIRQVDGMDIQLTSQKEPVFMLGNTVPGTKRAKLLSLGRESDYVQRMIMLYGDNLKDDRATVKNGEKRLTSIRERIEMMQGLDDMRQQIDKVEEEMENYYELANRRENLDELVSEMGALDREIKILKGVDKLKLPKEPVLKNEETLKGIVQIGREMSGLIERLSHLQALPELPQVPEISGDHDQFFRDFGEAMRQFNASDKDYQQAQEEAQQAQSELDAIIEELGNRCPLCDSPMEQHSH